MKKFRVVFENLTDCCIDYKDFNNLRQAKRFIKKFFISEEIIDGELYRYRLWSIHRLYNARYFSKVSKFYYKEIKNLYKI
jgi:hypothetical protein